MSEGENTKPYLYDQTMYYALETRAMKDNRDILSWDKHTDIPQDDAALDFVERFAPRFREFYEKHLEEIVTMCREHCPLAAKAQASVT